MSEVKMPVAAEEAQLICASLNEIARHEKWLTWEIADIQRRTILACAEWYRDRGGYGDIVGELQRMAASLGEPGK